MTDKKPTSGSIVFRQEDGATSPPIYVSDIGKGALLAAPFRECAHRVDLISHADENVLGWKNGLPWQNPSLAEQVAENVPIYDVPDDGYDDDDQSALYQRLIGIAQMLEWGFRLAVGAKPEHHDPSILHAHRNIDDDLYVLEAEGRLLRDAVRRAPQNERAALIDDWMSDAERSFVGYHLEFMALGVMLDSFAGYEDVNRLDQELARYDAIWEMETENARPV
ncbi:hypothetical protein [Yoonia sp. BS5-3]|uniref:Uncharacterized protein n=1 Tax=Yoonia phaeophyticola TaxID=3137369 RepID=A0ABZ2V9V0_9RHOB